MYIRIKDRVVIAANKIAIDLGVKVGGYCWREFMKESFISQKDKDILAKYPDTVPPELGIKCSFCIGDRCFTDSPEQHNSNVHAFGLIWDTYWIKVSDEVYLHYAVNITELRKAEETLRESEDKFKHFFEQSTVGQSLTLPTGEINVNQALCDMLGYSLTEIKNKKWQEITHPADIELTQREVEQLISGKRDFIRFIKRFIHKNGSVVWVDLISSVRRDIDGKSLYLMSSIIDITERKQAEQVLNDLVDNNPISIQILDKSGFTLKVNTAHSLLFGPPPPPEFSIFDDLHSKGFGEYILRAKKGEVVHFPDIYFKVHDIYSKLPDKPVWVRAVLFSLSDSAGNIERFVFMHEDITERKQTEVALQKSEDLLNETGRMAQVGGWEIDMIGNTLAWTKETFLIHELPQDSQPNVAGAINFYHPDDRKMVAAAVEQAITTGIPFDFEVRLITTLGNQIWVRSSGKTVSRNGKATGIRGSIQNITERKLIEDSLLHSKLQYDKLVSKIPVGVYILHSKPDGTYALDYVSPRMAEMLNLSVTSLLTYTQTIFEAIHPEDRDNFIKMNHDGILHCKPFNWKGRIVDGKTVKWMHIISSPEQLKTGDILWHGIIIDITERVHADAKIKQKNEELLMLNTDKDRLMSILAHDLKSPFNAILGFLDLLTENIRKYDMDKIEKQLSIINTSAQSVHNLLDHILIWTRSQAGKIPFEPTKLNLTKICNGVIDVLEQAAKAKNVTINHIENGDISIYADIEMVETILRNLVSNAIKFSHSGGKINLFAEQVGSETHITVFDNGVGISSEVQMNLFVSLELHSTRGTANESGTGLGLTICKDFVEKHGGRIWVESEEGKGSSFTFTIPNLY